MSWIKCIDRKPAEDLTVPVAFLLNGRNEICRFPHYYNHELGLWFALNDKFATYWHITYWYELPEPPNDLTHDQRLNSFGEDTYK